VAIDIVVAAADVGGIENFGWACLDGLGRRTGSHLRGLAEEVASFLEDGRPVALGFEAPVFVPSVEDAAEVLKAREGEWVYVRSPTGTRVKSGRSWSASSGAYSLLLALQQSEWLFRELGSLLRGVRVGYSPHDLAGGAIDLMVWEAFLSGEEAKAEASQLAVKDSTVDGLHQADAALMVESFRSRYPDDITHDITTKRGGWS
jgi:hypothetical protein